MSSSDSEDNSELKKLAEALDPDFLGVGKHKLITTNGTHENNSEVAPPSKRPKQDENINMNEYEKPYSLDVTPDCQNFIAKQLAKSVEKNIKEVCTILPSTPPTQETDTGIMLFSTSVCLLTEGDLQQNVSVRPHRRKSGKKQPRKEKRNQDEVDSSSSESEVEKLKSVAVTAEWVVNNT